MKVRFFDIRWDTEGAQVELPTECVLEDVDDDTDLVECGADLLSERFGWCVLSASYQVVQSS